MGDQTPDTDSSTKLSESSRVKPTKESIDQAFDEMADFLFELYKKHKADHITEAEDN